MDMTGFEEALKTARGWKDDIDRCTETEKAWIFSFSEERNNIGGPGPVVVMKDTGECIRSYVWYLHHVDFKDETVRSFRV